MVKQNQKSGWQFPDSLLKRVKEQLDSAGTLLADQTVSMLQKRVSEGHNPEYDRDWAAFSYSYFGANTYRSLVSLRHVPIVNADAPYRILDLGCGSGASAAGAVLALLPELQKNQRGIDILGVDQHRRQLTLFEAI